MTITEMEPSSTKEIEMAELQTKSTSTSSSSSTTTTSTAFTLQNIELTCNKSSLTAIVGHVGSGRN